MAEDTKNQGDEAAPAAEIVAEPTAKQPADVADLHARVAELEAENQRLRAEGGEHAQRHSGRNAIAIMVAIVAALAIALAVPAVWLNRMVTDTDVYVNTVAPLAEDPAIQAAVADAASTALIEKLDAQDRIERRLPEDLKFLAGPLSQAVDDLVAKQATTLVKSDQFASLWEKVNRASHTALVAAVTGREGKALNIEAGTFTLDVGVLAEEIQTRLEGAGLGTLFAKIPASALDKQFVLYESPVLAQMTQVFDLVSRSAFVIPLLGLILAVGAVALAADRRKVVLWLGAGIAVASLLPLESIYIGQSYATSQLSQTAAIPADAAQAAFTIIFRDLVTASQTAVFVGVVLWLAALISGPARWAVALRRGLSGGLANASSHLELGRFGAWMHDHKRGLRVVGVVVAFAILLMLPAPRTISSIVWLAVFYIVWVLAVEFFGGGSGAPVPESVDAAENPGAEGPAPQS